MKSLTVIKFCVLAILTVFAFTPARGALTETTGFTFSVTGGDTAGDYNSPYVHLQNDSTVADITRMVFTVGHTSYNFDIMEWFQTSVTGLTCTVNSPDEVNGALRSDELDLTFGGTAFGPNETFFCKVNMDPDNYNAGVNVRYIFFNNGETVPNSVVTVYFSNDQVLSETLPDFQDTNYQVSASVPEPATLALLSLGGFLLKRRR